MKTGFSEKVMVGRAIIVAGATLGLAEFAGAAVRETHVPWTHGFVTSLLVLTISAFWAGGARLFTRVSPEMAAGWLACVTLPAVGVPVSLAVGAAVAVLLRASHGGAGRKVPWGPILALVAAALAQAGARFGPLGEGAQIVAYVGVAAVGFGVLGGALVADRLAAHISFRFRSAGWTVLLVCAAILPHTTQEIGPASLGSLPSPDSTGPNVVLMVWDTVRADHLGIYGYGRDTAPALRQWVDRRAATVFDGAFSSGNWTAPTHGSLFSGLYPREHGARFPRRPGGFRLAAEKTVASVLSAVGYRSTAVFANPWLKLIPGMEKGFRVFRKPRVSKSRWPGERLRQVLLPGLSPSAVDTEPDALTMNRWARRTLEGCTQGGCFAFFNYIDAHSPYIPPSSCLGKWSSPRWSQGPTELARELPQSDLDRIRNQYDEEICGLDLAFDGFMLGLEAQGLLENTWIILTSDHGESFGEHGLTEHGTSLFNEQVRVPLVIFSPHGEGRRIDARTPVSSIDVATTVAAIGGAVLPSSGRDLRQVGNGGEPQGDSPVAVEFFGDSRKARRHGDRARDPGTAVIAGTTKLIRWGGQVEVYDLTRDSREREPMGLEALAPSVARRLSEFLEDRETPDPAPQPGSPAAGAPSPPVPERGVSADDLESLRALGYVE